MGVYRLELTGAQLSDRLDAVLGKYSKPLGGIPSTDLDALVQTSLGKADTALQEHQSLDAYRKSAAQDIIDAGKYVKPSSGIPSTDLDALVQTSLGKADSALQSHQDISGKEDKGNKVTALSPASTNTQYPGAKTVYDAIEDVREVAQSAGLPFIVSNTVNPGFNSQSGTIQIDATQTPIIDARTGQAIDFSNVKTGITFYVIELNVPDRWVGNIVVDGGHTIVTFHALETAKPAVLDVQRNGVSMLNLGVADILTEGTPTAGSTKLLESGGAKAYIDAAVAPKGAAVIDSPMVEGKDYQLGSISQLGLTLPASGGNWGMMRVCFVASTAFTPVISGTYVGETIEACVSGKTYEYLFAWNGTNWVLSILYY